MSRLQGCWIQGVLQVHSLAAVPSAEEGDTYSAQVVHHGESVVGRFRISVVLAELMLRVVFLCACACVCAVCVECSVQYVCGTEH